MIKKPSTCIDSSKDINDKDPKFEIGDIVRISKYKNIFAKGYVSNWSEEVFMIKNIKMEILNGKATISSCIDKKDIV